eukprot:CAMPEP_0114609428 /NCGR_PEP_ID=MMETSP0168-20121206/3084_1 /TAXON_ID=95228 ORGANISM="Vannella sp., Strain DIVA3 517/6/12" /NCGR_SAMPLE_ID=MMETSP0168 /ASSEMBLY_ACC=CAM_ASM_000044 /LENGTH=419 /DNA_ID=CAMNT_0001820347 /DNA_START=195 /DNA_END=1451 /DNA_ORIENTATION=+
MHRNYFIPTQAEGNSVLQRVKKDVEAASKALRRYIGLNSFHVTAQDQYEWVASLERPPSISVYAVALRTEPLVLRFQFSNEYPAKAPLVRVVRGLPHPMFFGVKLEMKCGDFWRPGKSTLTELLRAVWWTSVVPIVGMSVPRHPLCAELAARYRQRGREEERVKEVGREEKRGNGEARGMEGYWNALLRGAEQWGELGSKQKVSVSVEALGNVAPSLQFIRQLQLLEEERKREEREKKRAARASSGDPLLLQFRDSATGAVIPFTPAVTSAMTPSDIRDEITAAMEAVDDSISLYFGDTLIPNSAAFGSVLGGTHGCMLLTVVRTTLCTCCLLDVDFFEHLRFLEQVKAICSKRWSIELHQRFRHSLPPSFVATADLLLAAYDHQPGSVFAMLPLELLFQIIGDIWDQHVPLLLREFFH